MDQTVGCQGNRCARIGAMSLCIDRLAHADEGCLSSLLPSCVHTLYAKAADNAYDALDLVHMSRPVHGPTDVSMCGSATDACYRSQIMGTPTHETGWSLHVNGVYAEVLFVMFIHAAWCLLPGD